MDAFPPDRAPSAAGLLWFAARAATAEQDALAVSASPLYSADGVSPRERAWQLGKVENLRRAVRAIDGVRLPAAATFSFWRQVGPPWRSRGFVIGRELREGCLIPNVGGGLCQLSNALYDCALKAGAEIVERHAHTRVVPGSLAETGRDATVFWNYVDLRFRSAVPLTITARLTSDRLLVAFHGASAARRPDAIFRGPPAAAPPENCATCGVASCLRHEGPGGGGARERVAVLVDEVRPEFDAWLAPLREHGHLALPLRPSRWRRAAYGWTDAGWAAVRDVPGRALLRAWRSRRLAGQGAARQRALLRHDAELARALASRVPWQCSRAVVAQTLLPHLEASGWLGGRAGTVFLTRWPMRRLHEILDRASRAHPESPTLADFRVGAALADREWEALDRAETLVTCHARLAEIWPAKTILLPWRQPSAPAAPPPARAPLVVFPASGAGRLGAYELRAALRALRLPLRIAGRPQLENDPDFWRGVTLAPPAAHWLDGASLVVLPAWVEHRPRRLLEALAAGVPVIATDACGLHGWALGELTTLVPCGDADALARAIGGAVVPTA